jgi:hypothetical protein
VKSATKSFLFLALGGATSIVHAQEPPTTAARVRALATPQQNDTPTSSTISTEHQPRASRDHGPFEHHFWDKQNDLLFTGVAASRTFDYFSTLNMRRRGRQEILLTNDVVDNHAGFAFIEAGGTGVSILGSYLFHHYGHHRLERWTSIVQIGLASTGAVRNYCLKTAHTVPAQP